MPTFIAFCNITRFINGHTSDKINFALVNFIAKRFTFVIVRVWPTTTITSNATSPVPKIRATPETSSKQHNANEYSQFSLKNITFNEIKEIQFVKSAVLCAPKS